MSVVNLPLVSHESRIFSQAAFFSSTGANLHPMSHLCRRSAARECRTRVVGSSPRVRRKRRHFPGFCGRKKRKNVHLRAGHPIVNSGISNVATILLLSHYAPASLGSSHASASEAAGWLDLPELAPVLTQLLGICCPLLDQLKLCRALSEATVGGSQSLTLSSRPGDKHLASDGVDQTLSSFRDFKICTFL